MKKSSLILFLLLIFLLSACSPFCKPTVKYIEKPVFVKCKVPEVPESELQNIPENATYPIKLQIILNNYLKLQKENKMLREAMKVCQ